MDGMTYKERIRLSQRIPQFGQYQVMDGISQFTEIEICNTRKAEAVISDNVKAVVFNMERGVNLEETVDFLQQCPTLYDMDVILANELDDGNARSGMKDTTKIIAERLNLNYVFGLEFIELKNPLDEKGYHGNAIMSKWPITWAKSFYPKQKYDWYYSEQPRIGARVAIFAKIDVAGKEVGLITAHLENRTDPQGRYEQMLEILNEANKYFHEKTPMILGGDFNTYTFVDDKKMNILQFLSQNPQSKDSMEILTKEPLLQLLEDNHYNLRNCNDINISTCRETLKPENIAFTAKIDWIMTKWMDVQEYGVVSTLTSECSWVKSGSALGNFDKKEISDHDAVWVTTKI